MRFAVRVVSPDCRAYSLAQTAARVLWCSPLCVFSRANCCTCSLVQLAEKVVARNLLRVFSCATCSARVLARLALHVLSATCSARGLVQHASCCARIVVHLAAQVLSCILLAGPLVILLREKASDLTRRTCRNTPKKNTVCMQLKNVNYSMHFGKWSKKPSVLPRDMPRKLPSAPSRCAFESALAPAPASRPRSPAAPSAACTPLPPGPGLRWLFLSRAPKESAVELAFRLFAGSFCA